MIATNTQTELYERLEYLAARLAGPWTDEECLAVFEQVVADYREEPERLIEKWHAPNFAAAVEWEGKARADRLPKDDGVHLPAPPTPDRLAALEPAAMEYAEWLEAMERGEPAEFPAGLEPQDVDLAERRAFQILRERRTERRPNTPPTKPKAMHRPQGRAARPSTNGRSQGSRRASTASSGGGDPGDPDDADPSAPNGQGGRDQKGRHCLGCGSSIDKKRAGARYCGDRCRKRYVRNGRVAAAPVRTEDRKEYRRPELVGAEYHELAEVRRRLWQQPASRARVADLEGLMADLGAEYRLTRAARVRGLV